jgi:hypothetical protein
VIRNRNAEAGPKPDDIGLVLTPQCIARERKKSENEKMHRKLQHLVSLQFLFFVSFMISSFSAQAQSDSVKNKNPFPVKYRSIADDLILLKTITLAPVYDNQNGIYAKPVQELMTELLKSDKAWGYAEIIGHDGSKFIESYDTNSSDVIEVLSKTRAQGLLTAFITKGPRGINAKLKLFTHDQGLLLAEESIEDLNTFEVSKVRAAFVKMYQNLKNKLPYRGYVLSRRDLEVTISVGTVNGVKKGQELTVAQIIKINRHPKLNILIGVEKEIIARVVVTKAEPYLSFAQISFEKETGVLAPGAKVLPTEFISYPLPQLNNAGEVMGDVVTSNPQTDVQKTAPAPAISEESLQKSDDTSPQALANSKEKKEYLFERHSHLGIFTAQGSIAQFQETNNLSSGNSPSAKQSFAPGVFLGAQFYVIKDTFVEGTLLYHVFSVSNTLTGSVPFSLGYTYTKLDLGFGYDYNFEDDEDEIKFTGVLGYSDISSTVDESNPTALTSTKISALKLSARASMLIGDEKPFTLGGKFDLYFSPSLSESPVNSGSSSVNMTSFGFFGIYDLDEKYKLRADLTLLNLNSRFSGAGATRADFAGSGKQELITQQFGIEYLF